MYIFEKKDFRRNKLFFNKFFKLVEEAIRDYPTESITSNNPPSLEIFSLETGEILYREVNYNEYTEFSGKIVENILNNLPNEIKNLYRED